MIRRAVFTILFVLAVIRPSAAEKPQSLEWENLSPPAPDIADPLAHLEMRLQVNLHAIAGVRAQVEKGWISEVSPTVERAKEIEFKMKKEGVEVDILLDKLADTRRKIDATEKKVVHDLDGKLTRLSGFALPLEFSGKAVSEFFLVPYVGACIHVPPPPPNQMVFVRLDKPMKLGDVYTPVTVTGRMKVEHGENELAYMDGRSKIESAYAMQGLKIKFGEE